MKDSEVILNLIDWIDKYSVENKGDIQSVLRMIAEKLNRYDKLLHDMLSGKLAIIDAEHQNLVHWNALDQVIKVSEFGSKKYGASWRDNLSNPKCAVRLSPNSLIESATRHLFSITTTRVEPSLDSESGLHHAAHAIWNLMMLLEIEAHYANKQPV